jgi:hypothetical protein
MESVTQTKNYFGLQVRWLSLSTDFNQTSLIVAEALCALGVMSDLYQCNGMEDTDERLLRCPSKVPYFTDRLQANLYCFCHKRGECKVWCVSYIRTMKGEMHTRSYFDRQINCPSLLTDFNQICTDNGARVRSDRCYFSVTSLQWKARHIGNPIFLLLVKGPLLLSDVIQTCTVCGACVVSDKCDGSITSGLWKARYRRKTTPVSKSNALH